MDELNDRINDALEAFTEAIDEALGDAIDELDGTEDEAEQDIRDVLESLRQDPFQKDMGPLQDVGGWISHFGPAKARDLIKQNYPKL